MTQAERYPPLDVPPDTALRNAVNSIIELGMQEQLEMNALRPGDIYIDADQQPYVVLVSTVHQPEAQVWSMATDQVSIVAGNAPVVRVGRVPRVSRIDSKRSHGWLVRFYRGQFERSRLCSDRRYSSILGSLKAAATIAASMLWPDADEEQE